METTEVSVRHVKLSKSKQPKQPRQLIRYPWPRMAEDEKTPLGIDIEKKKQDIVKIVYKFFHVSEISMEELLQEVYLSITHKNYGNSAHDPRKSSFGHYIYMIANNVCINLVHRKERFEKERDSIDTSFSSENKRTLLDTIDIPVEENDSAKFDEKMVDFEMKMREKGLWDVARYVRAVRTGANPDVVRDALSWGNRKITNKVIRDLRIQIRNEISFFYGIQKSFP